MDAERYGLEVRSISGDDGSHVLMADKAGGVEGIGPVIEVLAAPDPSPGRGASADTRRQERGCSDAYI